MHNTFAASKLLEIIITEKHGHKKLNKYFTLVDFYENDSLPLHKLFSIRNIIIIYRRWRELFDLFYYFF
jgi:UDP-MurNAc hydroxylase